MHSRPLQMENQEKMESKWLNSANRNRGKQQNIQFFTHNELEGKIVSDTFFTDKLA